MSESKDAEVDADVEQELLKIDTSTSHFIIIQEFFIQRKNFVIDIVFFRNFLCKVI